jgi:hypothetical protein
MIRWGRPIMQDEEQIRAKYLQVFLDGYGPEVLTYILTDLGFFDVSQDEKAVALRNYAVRLLELLGVLHEQNAEDITRKLLRVTPYDLNLQRETIEKEFIE